MRDRVGAKQVRGPLEHREIHLGRELDRPVTDRTLFAAGSITKTFVAALMLKLAEHDVLDLDDT